MGNNFRQRLMAVAMMMSVTSSDGEDDTAQQEAEEPTQENE